MAEHPTDPADRCEWDDCPRWWDARVVIEWRQNSGPVPEEDYWLCREHASAIKDQLLAHHQDRIGE